MPGFFDRLQRAQALTQSGELMRAKLDLQRSAQGIDQSNVGLRGQELAQRTQSAKANQGLSAQRQNIDVWKSLSGGMGQYNPAGYAEGLGDLLHGNGQGFIDRMGAAQGVALGAKRTEAGQLAGTRAGAAAGAKSRQAETDNLRMHDTAQMDPEAMAAARAKGFKPFYPKPRQAGKEQSELMADDARKLSMKDVAAAQQMQKAGQPLTAGHARRVARAYILTDPTRAQAYQSATPEAQLEMEADKIEELDLEVE